jgi:1-deoxy-D-xylulose-5-phosphate reductoisomerase
MKKVVVLGSTGSIGRATLEVIEHRKKDFQVFALAARSNLDLLVKQAKRFRPKLVITGDNGQLSNLRKKLGAIKISVLAGIDGLIEASIQPEVDIVVMAMSGLAGVFPTLAAIEKRKRIALATKEILVSFGKIIMEKSRLYNTEILPIDSEQVALHQCLNGSKLTEVKKVILTASGGPFLQRKSLKNVKLSDALRHPIWQMGKKITIDSATLMNKGLEVIETVRFWNFSPQKVEVLIHPQSLIHSMVEFLDGSILAQLAVPDMRLPIQYALTFPERLPSLTAFLDFSKLRNFDFFRPDLKKFPCLKLADQAIQKDNGYPCVLNAANEIAVEAFLSQKLNFAHIPKIIAKTLAAHQPKRPLNLAQLISVDKWARNYAIKLISKEQS